MRKTLLAAVAAAAILTLGAPADRATAMTVAAPAALGLTAPDAGLVQQARWHRWHHWGWGWRHRYWGPYWGAPWGWGCCWGGRHHWHHWGWRHRWHRW